MRYVRKSSRAILFAARFRDRVVPWLPLLYKLPWGTWALLFRDESRDAILRGCYNEQVEIRLLQRLLKPGMVFFDVGANQGLYSMVASKAVGPQGSVHAFEPVPTEYRKLRLNRVLNLAWNVHTIRLAVSQKRGSARMYAVVSSMGSYSSLRKPAADVKAPSELIDVGMISLDEYVEEKRVKAVDVLKMDVEGGEMDVARGGMSLWSAKVRPIVFCEVNDKRTAAWGYKAHEIPEFFVARDYSPFLPTLRGLALHRIQREYAFTNMVMVPEERLDLVHGLLCNHEMASQC